MDVHVIGEIDELGRVSALTAELLGLARDLVSESGVVSLVAICERGKAAEQACGLGADRFLTYDAGSEAVDGDLLFRVARRCCEADTPEAFLFGHTPLGEEVACRLAFSFGLGLVTDCTGISASPEGLLFEKPVYGGNALAVYRVRATPAVATVRPHVGKPPESRAGGCEVIELEAVADTRPALDRLETVKEAGNGVRLDDAKVVVSGGRGIGGPESFEELSELASLLGGAVGASRPPCDSGWIPCSHQVGITGSIISPDLYIAVAISGSSQHLSGMSDSGTIVAINSDPDAFMFKVSDYGVVGDWRKVIPSFAEKLRELKERA